jgi:hypothetical protein
MFSWIARRIPAKTDWVVNTPEIGLSRYGVSSHVVADVPNEVVRCCGAAKAAQQRGPATMWLQFS